MPPCHLKRTTTSPASYVSQAFGLLCSAPLEFPEAKASGTYIVLSYKVAKIVINDDRHATVDMVDLPMKHDIEASLID